MLGCSGWLKEAGHLMVTFCGGDIGGKDMLTLSQVPKFFSSAKFRK